LAGGELGEAGEIRPRVLGSWLNGGIVIRPETVTAAGDEVGQLRDRDSPLSLLAATLTSISTSVSEVPWRSSWARTESVATE